LEITFIPVMTKLLHDSSLMLIWFKRKIFHYYQNVKQLCVCYTFYKFPDVSKHCMFDNLDHSNTGSTNCASRQHYLHDWPTENAVSI